MRPLLESVFAVGVGIASALVPIINAEIYAALAGARSHLIAGVAITLCLAAGQTIGKAIFFEAAHRGSQRFQRRGGRRQSEKYAKWAEKVRGWLSGGRSANLIVFASAVIGIPPLAITSIAAGAFGQSRKVFYLLCFVGRTIRFGAVILPITWAV